MRKTILGLTAAAAVLAFSAVSFAATEQAQTMGTPCGGRGMGPRMMTAQDKADFVEFQGKKLQLMKDNLAEDVKSGRISQKEADAMLVLMQARFDRMQKDDFTRKAPTEADIQAMKDRQTKMLALHKEFLQKQVAEGKLTQEQADQRISRMQEHINNFGTNGHGPRHGGMGPMMDPMGPMGMGMGPMGGPANCPPADAPQPGAQQ